MSFITALLNLVPLANGTVTTVLASAPDDDIFFILIVYSSSVSFFSTVLSLISLLILIEILPSCKLNVHSFEGISSAKSFASSIVASIDSWYVL